MQSFKKAKEAVRSVTDTGEAVTNAMQAIGTLMFVLSCAVIASMILSGAALAEVRRAA